MPRYENTLEQPFGQEAAQELEWGVNRNDQRRSRPPLQDPQAAATSQTFSAVFAELLSMVDQCRLEPWYLDDVCWSEGYVAGNQESLPEEWTPEVLAFCRDYGALLHLKNATRIALKFFPSATITNIRLKQDPETGAEWLQVKVVARATIDEAAGAYDHYISEWVKVTSPKSRSLIRLSFKTV